LEKKLFNLPLPPELETTIREEARLSGTSPELFLVEDLRERFLAKRRGRTEPAVSADGSHAEAVERIPADVQAEITGLLDELRNAPMQAKPMSGADAIAYWKANNLLGSYGDPAVDSVELARQLRTEAERRSINDA
jgi:hypothetical protein